MVSTQGNFKSIIPLLRLTSPEDECRISDREVEKEADLTGHAETVRNFLRDSKVTEKIDRCETMFRRSTALVWDPQ